MDSRITFPAILLVGMLTMNCRQSPPENNQPAPELKISLAQWSLHRAFQTGELDPDDFAVIAHRDYDIHAIEYVNQFYINHRTDTSYWKSMRRKADSLGVRSLLIMIDGEGDLGDPDSVARDTTVRNHFPWIDAARILGCHSVRINAFGTGSKEEVKAALVESLRQLGDYAAKDSIHVVIENHGLYSSDGKWIAQVIREVNRFNVGTLPDFGNWCLAEKWGSTETSKPCAEAYDRYQGVAEMLPFAVGVSAKSYDFSKEGEDTVIDYGRMLQVVRDSGFDGYIGIEYEGSGISEPEGIRATKALLEKKWPASPKP